MIVRLGGEEMDDSFFGGSYNLETFVAWGI
jgi:hypothetical protein